MILDKRADLGHGDVKKLLFSLSVPTITSQIVNMLYNLVDRVFIGHMQPTETVGKLALTGVGVCLPIIMVISAFASLMAIGGAPRASIAEGAGESEKSERIMGNCLTMLLVTALVVGVRFLWVLVMERVHRSSKPRTGGQLVRDALVTTLSGPKGAITLSIIMTIPFTLSTGEAFPQRDNLIFLASGVILCTLLLANFVVPLLAPKEQADEQDEQAVNAANIEILKRVIRQMREQKTPTNEASTQIVIRQYSERIKRLRRKNTSAPCLLELRATAIEQQKDQVDKYIREGRISRAEGEREIERLESSRRTLLRAHTRRQALGEVWSRLKVGAVHTARRVDRAVRHVVDDEAQIERHRQLRIELEECALAYYNLRMSDENLEIADGAGVLAAECRSTLAFLRAVNEPEKLASANVAGSVVGMDAGGMRGALEGMDTQKIQVIKARVSDVEAEALRIELEEIQAMRDEGSISRETARNLREEVYLLQMAIGE